MDSSSSSPVPPTTLRRNPPRRARRTPSAAGATAYSAAADRFPPFPIHELLHQDHPHEALPPLSKPQDSAGASFSENLKVFLRIRPLDVSPPNAPGRKPSKADARASAKAQPSRTDKSKSCICLVANGSSSVTLSAPPSRTDSRGSKSEVFDGLSYVFPPDSRQQEVYDRVVNPLLMDFIGGKSGLLVALGPTGSGKTFTMFGSTREPGMVRLTLEKLFGRPSQSEGLHPTRSFYISMFEIYSERGKGERILDLSPNGVDLSLQQSAIIGLQEVMASTLEEAEGLLVCGMLKRSTAVTSANYQSSRSQCIINIRSAEKTADSQRAAVLTIADLAGAEREKKTGNQGSRLLESNFINNTSMVFGLCLRSLLEHQKNPKKPLEKHFMNSLLTKYLRDYMEGKKRMTLILTVKPGEDDYVETSLLLRHASPYMKIKYNNLEEKTSLPSLKRNICYFNRVEHKKRKVEVKQGTGGNNRFQASEEAIAKSSELNYKLEIELQRMLRKEEIMRNFAKAFWTVLKQYKQKLVESEKNLQSLMEALDNSKIQVMELTKELGELRSSCSCHKVLPLERTTTAEMEAISDFCSSRLRVQPDTAMSTNLDAVPISQAMPESSQIIEDDPGREVLRVGESQPEVYSGVSKTDLPAMDQQIHQLEQIESLDENTNSSQIKHCSAEDITRPNTTSSDDTHVNNLVKSPQSCIRGVKGTSIIPQASSMKKVRISTPEHSVLFLSEDQGLQSVSRQEVNDLQVQHHAETELSSEKILAEMQLQCFDYPQSNLVKYDGVILPVSENQGELAMEDEKLVKKIVILEARGPENEDIRSGCKHKVQELPTQHAQQYEKVHARKALKEKNDLVSKPLNPKKSKRKLLPASTMLLKEFTGLDMEAAKPKDHKSKLNEEGQGRSQGSISLISLLKSNLHK